MDQNHVEVDVDGLQVRVAPGMTVALDDLPPHSIALDGVVQGPQIDSRNRRLSFDHHGPCVRLATSATCRQVMDALLLGLEPTRYTVYVNDLDADTVLSVALLAYPAWLGIGSPFAARARALVEAVGSRDAHGPAYPVADAALLRAFSTAVLAPAPVGGTGHPYAMADPLREQVRRLAQFVTATELQAAKPPPAREFAVTHTGTGWVMATSDVPAFDLVYAAGHSRAVLWQRLSDGTVAYTVGRHSDLVDGFPVGPVDAPGTILAALADREPGWGGGSSIGGAPRHPDGSRSRLDPDEVFAIVEATVTAAPKADTNPSDDADVPADGRGPRT